LTRYPCKEWTMVLLRQYAVLLRRPYNRWLASTLQKRTFMDVHQRPSHSGMFVQPTPPPSSLPRRLPPSAPPNSQPPWWEECKILTLIVVPRLLLAMGMVHVTSEYFVDITLCEGPSMAPTIRPYGEIILLDKYTIRNFGSGTAVEDIAIGSNRCQAATLRQERHSAMHGDDEWHAPCISVTEKAWTWRDAWQQLTSPLSVGDVVVTQHPHRPGTVCKRVVGMPGDQVLLAPSFAQSNASWLHRSNNDMGSEQRYQRRFHHLLIVPDGHVWLEGDNASNSSDSRVYGPLPMALIQGRVIARLWPMRGQAWMRRGGPPQQAPHASGNSSRSTVLPAGYGGQDMVTQPASPKKERAEQTPDANAPRGSAS
jgi:mitochondrial inner membrane protease subunit 1